MAQTENKFKQRIVGAVVLVALAVIFLPMLFNEQVEQPEMDILVNVPAQPIIPEEPEFAIEEIVVPEPVLEPQIQPAPEPATPEPVTAPEPKPAEQTPPAPVTAPAIQQPAVKPGIDSNNLPQSWSIQLASLSKQEGASRLRDEYRTKGYKSYVRPEANSFKVLIGPFIRQADAQRECDKIRQREKSKDACFVVRFQP